MKKYIVILTAVFYVALYCNAQNTTDSPENVVNTQTKNMLEEIRRRNGIDTAPYRAVGKKEQGESGRYVTNMNLQASPDLLTAEAAETNATTKVKKNNEPAFDSRRTAFATGLDISIGASNSYYKITDFFKPVLEIDFDAMSEKMPKQGLSATATAYVNMFFNIYIKNKYEIGSYTSVNGYQFSNVSKNIIDFISKGNKLGEKISGTASSSIYGFASTSVFFGMKIGNFTFKLDTSYFIPIAYLNYKDAHYEFYNDAVTGKTTANVNAEMLMYVNLPYIIKGNSIKKIFKNGGVDLNLSGSYSFSPIANLNFSLDAVPLFAARMNNGYVLTMDGKIELDAMMPYIQSMLIPNQNSQVFQGITPSFVWDMKETELPEKKVSRPLKLSISSDIRPFGNNYLIITPNIGCSCYKPFYLDAGIKVESRFLKVLGAYYSLNREDRIWKNCLGLFLDARVFRLELAVSSVSPSFANSFKGSGAEAYIGFVLGW